MDIGLPQKFSKHGHDFVGRRSRVPRHTALELANQILEGNINLDTAIAADRRMAAHVVVEKESEEEMVRAIELIQSAWEERYRMVMDLEGARTVRSIVKRMQTGGCGTRISIKDRKSWFRNVMNDYEIASVQWRRFGAPRPSLSSSVAAKAANFEMKSIAVHIKNTLAEEQEAYTPRGRTQRTRP